MVCHEIVSVALELGLNLTGGISELVITERLTVGQSMSAYRPVTLSLSRWILSLWLIR